MTDLREVLLDGQSVALLVRRNRQARRIQTRIDPTSGTVVLVLPMSASEAQGFEFLRKNAAWLLHRLSKLPPRIPFANGAIIPYRGVSHRIRHEPVDRPHVRLAEGIIETSGSDDGLARRLTTWLRAEARATIEPLAMEKATVIGCKPYAVSIRDQKSRWGSCSSTGHLSFNWRLIMAPHNILDYVVAHEAAHLAQMNHSAQFWRIVGQLTGNAEQARDWLKIHGGGLHRYG
jgi:predicted metal-dependent hydrolase